MKAMVMASALAIGTLTFVPTPSTAAPPTMQDWLAGPEGVLLTRHERNLLDAVRTGADTERFIAWFWDRRDPQPATEVNEFRSLFRERIGRARKLYDRGSTPGWRTAPGMLLALLGDPKRTYPAGTAYADGAFREVTVWEYDDPRDGRTPVHFFLLDSSAGTDFAVGDESGPSSAQLAMLEVAREALVRGSQAFEAVGEMAHDRLPASGLAIRHADGVLAHLRLPLHELRGAPVAGGIVFTFDASVQTASGTRRLGVIQAQVRQDQAGSHRESDLELVGWFPLAEAGDAVLQLVEMPAQRALRVIVDDGPAAPASFDIAREICVTDLMRGAGAVVAFFATTADSPEPVAVLRSSPAEGADPIAGSRLYLDRRGTTGR